MFDPSARNILDPDFVARFVANFLQNKIVKIYSENKKMSTTYVPATEALGSIEHFLLHFIKSKN